MEDCARVIILRIMPVMENTVKKRKEINARFWSVEDCARVMLVMENTVKKQGNKLSVLVGRGLRSSYARDGENSKKSKGITFGFDQWRIALEFGS